MPRDKKHNLKSGARNLGPVLQALRNGENEHAFMLARSQISKAPRNTKLALAAAMAFRDVGDYTHGFSVLELSLKSGGASLDILKVMAMFASDLGTHDVALKITYQLIEQEPSEPSHYINYCHSLVKLGRVDEAIGLLQTVLPQFPDAAKLWNLLGTILADEVGDHATAETFLLEAARIAPDDFDIITNLANLYSGGPRCYPYYEKAIALRPDAPEPHIGYALRLFSDSRLFYAYEHYEHRLKPHQGPSKTPVFEHPGKIWRGEDLSGKTLLVMAEQGLGDEVLFSALFHRASREASHTIISCDPRLVEIFRRTFPDCEIIAYEDRAELSSKVRSFPAIAAPEKVDYAICAGSLMQYFWPAPSSVIPLSGPALIADEKLVNSFSQIIRPSSQPLKVGLSWRSGKSGSGRGLGYLGIDDFAPILSTPNTDFFVTQYGVTDEERAHIQAQYPEVKFFDGIDLKADIESTLAIMENLDLMIGPCVSTQTFALLLNKPVCMIVRGRPWWAFGHHLRADGPYLAPECQWIFSNTPNWIEPLHDRMTTELRRKTN